MALLVLLLAVCIYFFCFLRKDGFYLKKYANADAKFYRDHVITSVDEEIRMLDFHGRTVRSYEGLKASWIYTYPEEGLIVYSNHDREIHLLKLDESMDMISDEVILTSELLAIDPTICKAGDTYLVTYTTIEGTINNPDPDGENGTYSLELFASKDLKTFEHCTTIVSEKHDIEDIDLMYEEGILYCIYEKEDYDKGPSKICLRTSSDEGKHWEEERVLVENGGDNEPACVMKTKHGYRLFYSSDRECPGESYNGASVYYACFDRNFQRMKETDTKLPMEDNFGIRLYEVTESEEGMYFMYARNFMTDKDFVLRRIKQIN